MTFIAIIVLFCLLILLRFVQRQTRVEKFVDSKLVKSFKIRVGVWYDKNFNSMYNFLYRISSFIPMEIVTYSNHYQPFYELKLREVDLIFTNEKDYYVYWINQLIKKRTLKDYLRRDDLNFLAQFLLRLATRLENLEEIKTNKKPKN